VSFFSPPPMRKWAKITLQHAYSAHFAGEAPRTKIIKPIKGEYGGNG